LLSQIEPLVVRGKPRDDLPVTCSFPVAFASVAKHGIDIDAPSMSQVRIALWLEHSLKTQLDDVPAGPCGPMAPSLPLGPVAPTGPFTPGGPCTPCGPGRVEAIELPFAPAAATKSQISLSGGIVLRSEI
jgi:hypothetical protein